MRWFHSSKLGREHYTIIILINSDYKDSVLPSDNIDLNKCVIDILKDGGSDKEFIAL